jgi:hypothetical protein
MNVGLMLRKYGALKQTRRLKSQRPAALPPSDFQSLNSGLLEG